MLRAVLHRVSPKSRKDSEVTELRDELQKLKDELELSKKQSSVAVEGKDDTSPEYHRPSVSTSYKAMLRSNSFALLHVAMLFL